MRSTESLAFFPAGAEDLGAAGSDPADSLFLVALCTDGLRITRQVIFAALQFRSTRNVGRLRGCACKILREIRIWRDGLDHILESVTAEVPTRAG
jgi:hypothetical protein